MITKDTCGRKVPVDEQDLDDLLDITLEQGMVLDDDEALPLWLIEESRERVRKYINCVPESAAKWREIGFSRRRLRGGRGC